MATAFPLVCPVAERCESCGDIWDLDVHEAGTVVGVLCVTLCGDCAEIGDTPPLDCPGAVRRVLTHMCHLDSLPTSDLNGVAA